MEYRAQSPLIINILQLARFYINLSRIDHPNYKSKLISDGED